MKNAVPNKRAAAILDRISYITIATVSGEGQPWNTPVAGYHFANDYTFYWASWVDNQHSQNIRANGKVFIVVYDSTPSSGKPSQGVYIQAEAIELVDHKEVMEAAKVFGNDPYNPSDGNEYLDSRPRRIYKATPLRIWLNDDNHIDGNFIDVRVRAEAS